MAPPAQLRRFECLRRRAESRRLSVTADVFRFQADNSTMQGVRLFVVNNTSSPAKTQLNDHNFEFFLPVGSSSNKCRLALRTDSPSPLKLFTVREK